MQVVPSNRSIFYVHKFRLESRDGAEVPIESSLLAGKSVDGSRVVAHFVAAAFAAISLLLLIATIT